MAREFAKAFYHSKAWLEVRDYIVKRDNYKCQICGDPGEEVHHKVHLTEKNINDPWVTLNPANLILLCWKCHKDEHKQDKSRGQMRDKTMKDLVERIDNNYMFDSNGMLVKKPEII